MSGGGGEGPTSKGCHPKVQTYPRSGRDAKLGAQGSAEKLATQLVRMRTYTRTERLG
jgi:hypothetical protein